MTPMRVVTPFKPFAPESQEHLDVGPFDWCGAIEMLRASVARFCGCKTVVITDMETEVPGHVLRYETRERRLMLWMLEIALRYLASSSFDRNTVMVCPDALVFCDLRPWFAGEFGIVVRPDHEERPILNGVQWWPVAAKARLIDLYEAALDIAQGLPEEFKVWGADSEPFRRLLRPLFGGCGPRDCGIVANLVDARNVLRPLSSGTVEALEAGAPIGPVPPVIVDFKYTRKHQMRAFFEATLGSVVSA